MSSAPPSQHQGTFQQNSNSSSKRSYLRRILAKGSDSAPNYQLSDQILANIGSIDDRSSPAVHEGPHRGNIDTSRGVLRSSDIASISLRSEPLSILPKPPPSPALSASTAPSATKPLTPQTVPAYRDFSRVPTYIAFSTITEELEHDQSSFPFRLFNTLEQAPAFGFSHIMSWLPHGRAFFIYDVNLFNESKEFDLGSFETFEEELRSRGFNRFTVPGIGGNYLAFYHELFLRGRRSLCHGLVKSQSYIYREQPPNFYVMQAVDLLAKKELQRIQLFHFQKQEASSNMLYRYK